MSTNAVAAQGTTLAVGTTTDATNFTTLTEISTFSGPVQSSAEYEVTDLSSTAKEFKQALDDPGTLTMSIFYKGTDTEHILIRDRVGSGTSDFYKLTFADSSNVTFAAEVNGFTRNASVDGPATADVSLRISGALTEATS